MNQYIERINRIEARLAEYYETDYASELQDDEENLRLKTLLVGIVQDAQNHLNGDELKTIKDKVFEVLSRNTGCIADIEVLNRVSAGVLSESEVSMILSTSPVQRWS